MVNYRKTDGLYALILIALVALWSELFYRMTVDYHGNYKSDFDAYVNMGKDGFDYAPRLVITVFGRLYRISETTFEIAVFSAVVCCCVVLLSYYLISFYLKMHRVETSRATRQFFSLALVFAGSIYLPGIHEFFYKDTWSSFSWQSPTHQLMTLFSLAAVIFFLKMYNDYEEHIDIRCWLGFMISAGLSAYSKPSFVLTFIPAMVVLFLIDLVRKRRAGRGFRRFGRMVLIGSSLIPPGLYLLYMNSRIYTAKSDSQIVFGIAHNLLSPSVLIQIVLGLAFPIVVFLFNIRKWKQGEYLLAIVNALIGIAEWVLLAETGHRAAHGNFSWGKTFGLYYIFLCSYVMAIENYKDKSFLGGHSLLRKLYFVIIGILFLLHLISQLIYFYLVLTGHGFWI